MTTGQDKSKPSYGEAGVDPSRYAGMPIFTKIGPATEMQWLFQGRVPRGQVTLIEGAHGAGKSFVALDLAARFTRGLAWPAPWPARWQGDSRSRGEVFPESGLGDTARILANAATGDCGYPNGAMAAPKSHLGNVLLVTQQDDSGTVDRRLAWLGADIDRVCRIETVETEEGEELSRRYDLPMSSPRPLEFPRDVAVIREELALDGPESIELVVIDPLSDFCDGPARVAQTLRELSKLAREMGVAIVVTLPANCRFDARGALRVTSRYKTEAARCVWCVVADRDNPARRLFVARRTNSCVEPPGLAFRLHEGHVIWNAEIPIDALDPLGQEAAIRDYLTSALGSGSLPVADVIRLGALAGFAAAQLRVVAKLMGIEFQKMPGFGKEGGWEWVGAARERGGEKGERRKDGRESGEPCGVSPRVSGAARERGDEKVERRKDETSSGDGALSLDLQQCDVKPPEGGTRTTQAQRIEVPVVISGVEIFARLAAKEAEGGKGKGEERREKSESLPQASSLTPDVYAEVVVASRVANPAPVAAVVTAKKATVEDGAAADAKNSKSMENRGKNGHESNGRLPRDKYARAQERKRRERQRREGVVGGGRR